VNLLLNFQLNNILMGNVH